MKKSKKQIFLVYDCNEGNELLSIIFATTSITKLKSFLAKKIKEGGNNIYYDSKVYTKNQQVQIFKFDFKNHHRNIINENLHGLKYDYVYDGEEI